MTKTTQLSNGMKLVFEQKKSMHSVAFGLWVRVGSIDDGLNLGIAHFIEHMIFKGNEKWSAKQIASHVDLLGAQLNAFTEKESTCYYGRVIDEEFSSLLTLVSEIVLNPAIRQADVEKERQVILEEIKMDLDTPDERIHDLLDALMFEPTPYAKGILGEEKTVSAMESSQLKTHHQTYYQPNQMVLSIVGNGDFETYVNLVEELFSQIPSERKQVSSPLTNVASATKAKHYQHHSKETEQLHLVLGLQFQPLNQLMDRIYLSMINSYLGSSMSSRLFQEFREERGWVYSIYSYSQLFQHHSAFNIYAGFQPERTEEVISLLAEIFQDLREKGIDSDSIHTFQRYLKGTLAISDESPTSRMNYLGRATLFNEPLYDSEEILAGVEAIDEAELNAFLISLLKQDISVVTLGPISMERTEKIAISVKKLNKEGK
ncbi:pitrilysin family protein [Gottschalkiaceae bacterium SANA]|nr:pitrilysin family protein [Gottschalkiaceae bacterium SANA]